MRRTFFGLVILAAAAGLILTTSCQHERAMQIVSINDHEPLMSDIIDFGSITITEPGEEPEIYLISQFPEDVVDIEFLYVETGLGLPTWTPYKVQISKITIDYMDAEVLPEAAQEYGRVILPASITVESDPEGEKTVTARFALAPAQWKEFYFGDDAQDAPEDDDYGVVATVKAKVSVEGTDQATGNKVTASAEVTIVVGNFWDDPDRLGQ